MKLHQCILMGPLHHSAMTSCITTQTCLLTTFAGGVGKTAFTDSLCCICNLQGKLQMLANTMRLCVKGTVASPVPVAQLVKVDDSVNCVLCIITCKQGLSYFVRSESRKAKHTLSFFFSCSQYSTAPCAPMGFPPNRKSHLGRRRSSLTLPRNTFMDILMGRASFKHATSLMMHSQPKRT